MGPCAYPVRGIGCFPQQGKHKAPSTRPLHPLPLLSAIVTVLRRDQSGLYALSNAFMIARFDSTIVICPRYALDP
jgi:hypothetical protein